MTETPPFPVSPPPFVPPGSTAAGARTVRAALGKLHSLASIALAIAVLALVEAYFTWSGIFGKIPAAGTPWNLSWTVSLQLAIAVAFGIAIAVLVIIAIVTAILGLVSWRRGVLAMVAASSEFGPAQVEACRTARRDHSVTLWLFLGIVIAAIVASVAFLGVNGSLALAGIGSLPGSIGTVATALATGSVLVAIYYFGTRHLVELLSAVATATERSLLERGRIRMIAGAIVGLGAAFSTVSWAFDVFGIVSLAMIIPGVRDLGRAYDLWLTEHAVGFPPVRAPGVAPA
jgi:hypothetical protein